MDSVVALIILLLRYVIKPVRLINDVKRWWYRLNARHRMSGLFPEFFALNTRLTIVLPSIRLKPSSNESHIVAYKAKDFGNIPGHVNTTRPFIRHTDALATGVVRNLFSPWFPELSEKLDDELTTEDCHGNIVCIGGQTNWIFRQYFYDQHMTPPLEYHLMQGQNDCFTDTRKDTTWSSDDKRYAYGLICSIKNNEKPQSRVLFLSGLSHPETIATARRLSSDVLSIYREVKNSRLLRSDFYCIVKFRRTNTPSQPLAFDSYITGLISQ